MIDGSNIVHRSYSVVNQWVKLVTFDDPKAGTPGYVTSEEEWIKVVRQATMTTCLQSIAIFLERREAHGCLLPLDVQGELLNREIAADYKDKDYDSKKYAVINWVRANLLVMMPKFGISTSGVVGVEADDLGYVITRMTHDEIKRLCKIPVLSEDTVKIDMMTRDVDWYQSITETATWVNAETYEVRDLETVMGWWGADWRLTFLATKAIMGDSSDGIANIPKCGEAKSDICRTWIYNVETGQIASKEEIEHRLGHYNKYVWAKSLLSHYDMLAQNWELVDLHRNYRNGTAGKILAAIWSFSLMTYGPERFFDQLDWADAVALTESNKLSIAGRRYESYMARRNQLFAE